MQSLGRRPGPWHKLLGKCGAHPAACCHLHSVPGFARLLPPGRGGLSSLSHLGLCCSLCVMKFFPGGRHTPDGACRTKPTVGAGEPSELLERVLGNPVGHPGSPRWGGTHRQRLRQGRQATCGHARSPRLLGASLSLVLGSPEAACALWAGRRTPAQEGTWGTSVPARDLPHGHALVPAVRSYAGPHSGLH